MGTARGLSFVSFLDHTVRIGTQIVDTKTEGPTPFTTDQRSRSSAYSAFRVLQVQEFFVGNLPVILWSHPMTAKLGRLDRQL